MGWCCFELAVFKAFRPDSPVVVFPIDLYMSIFVISLCYVPLACLFIYLWPIVPEWWGEDALFCFAVLLGMAVMASCAEKVFVDQLNLQDALATFDINAAQFTVASDRASSHTGGLPHYEAVLKRGCFHSFLL